MPLWILSPIDRSANVWHTYSFFQKLVVRAPSADEARETAAEDQFGVREKPWDSGALSEQPDNPWRRPSDTSCDEIDSYTTWDGVKIDSKGPTEVVARE